MGQLFALIRAPLQHPRNEETSQVHFPPRSGCYFGSYFIMGGESFNTGRNDAYLFGEPNDLTFLNRRPASFPYPAPAASEPSKTLQSLVNIRRDSVKIVKIWDEQQSYKHTVEFTLDTEAPCSVYVMTSTREDGISAHVRNTSSKSWSFPVGVGQTFFDKELVFIPVEFSQSMFKYGSFSESFPLTIHVVVDGEFQNHSHTVYCQFEKSDEPMPTYGIKVLKQKQNIDGISFILQEIYGMESKGSSDKSVGNGECVVCLNAPRDTMILPCRHLCLCYSCAEDVRFKSNVCLMCRQPFRALLRIEALQRVPSDESECRSDERFEHVDLVQYTCSASSKDSDSRVSVEGFGMAAVNPGDESSSTLEIETVDVETDNHAGLPTDPATVTEDEDDFNRPDGPMIQEEPVIQDEDEEPSETDRSSVSTMSPIEV